MPDPTLESTVRASLEEEQGHLRAQLQDLGEDGADLSFDENFADSAQVAAEQGEAKALAGSLREQLDEVEEALGRLESGEYGRCERCGNPIADARLEAMPATRYCIDHA